jgi:eukaryotic-like serine/threonine-protein kinase
MGVEHIGKYRVLAKLGQGGMARVLLTMAHGPHGFNKLLVVKELREELASDPEFLSMFMDEARIAARLNHPNIVQTYEVGSEGERHFIAMEYLEGQPLNAIFRRVGRKNIPLEIHLKVLAEVLGGLEHAHKLSDYDGTPLGVVHRDVSPQNVFVTYDGQVKLVDFGIAKAAGASSRTQEGMLKGKISYIAPEQARCEPVDRRADLFTVGVMLWEAIAGRRMVTREDEMSVLARRMAGQDQLIRSVVPDVPAELAAICDRSMAPHAADRFQSAHEFQEVLERYLAASDFRVGPKDIGGMVSHAFDDERRRIRATIEEQVKNVNSDREPINLELVPASLKQTSDSLARVMPPFNSDTPPALLTGTNTQLSQMVPPRPKNRSLLPALAVGSVLAVGALGAVMYFRNENADKQRANADAASPKASAEPAAEATATTAAAASAGNTNTIAINVAYPDGARLKLDSGYVEGNPFKANVPKDGTLHKIEVEQDGFRTERRTVTFDKDVELSIELKAAPGRPYAVSRPTTKPPPTTEPPPAVTTAPKPEEDPGKKKPKPTVELDEQNPYKKKP